MDTPLGKQLVYQRVDLNEDALREIAAATGGRYFLASNTDDLSKIYGIIDSLEKHEVRIKEFFHYNELYLFFLIPALAALAAEFLLKATIVRVLP
jgi:Ca-activated chloride channel family protein